MLRDTQSNRATQNFMQESGCRALQPMLKVPPVLSFPSAGRRFKGVRSLLLGARKVCVSATPTGAPSGTPAPGDEELQQENRAGTPEVLLPTHPTSSKRV